MADSNQDDDVKSNKRSHADFEDDNGSGMFNNMPGGFQCPDL